MFLPVKLTWWSALSWRVDAIVRIRSHSLPFWAIVVWIWKIKTWTSVHEKNVILENVSCSVLNQHCKNLFGPTLLKKLSLSCVLPLNAKTLDWQGYSDGSKRGPVLSRPFARCPIWTKFDVIDDRNATHHAGKQVQSHNMNLFSGFHGSFKSGFTEHFALSSDEGQSGVWQFCRSAEKMIKRLNSPYLLTSLNFRSFQYSCYIL